MQASEQSQEPGEVRPPAERRRRLRRLAIYVAVALLIGSAGVAPFYFSRYERSPDTGEVNRLIVTHDLVMHLPQAQDFDRVLRSGVIYPRWLPNINHGYGVVTMVFYPPGQFYLMALFNAIFNDWVNGLFALSALGLAASGLAFYLYARLFVGRVGSGAASILYMLLPFHTLNLYWQGAIPQFLGYAFMPLVMYFAYKSGREGKPRHMAALGLIYGLYLLTHLPVAYLFTYLLALYLLVWAAAERDWKVGLRISTGMTLGLLLSAIYWLPAALETKYIYEWSTEALPYKNTLIKVATPDGPFMVLIFLIFGLQVLTLAVVLLILGPSAFKARPTREGLDLTDPDAARQVRIWVLMAVLTTFFNTWPAWFILRLIPRLHVATPAWRWLAIAGFFTCLLIAVAIERLRAKADRPSAAIPLYRAAVVAVFILTFFFTVRYVIIGALSNPTYKPPAVYVDSGFTPKGATPPDQLPDVPLVRLVPESAKGEVIRWDPQHREVRVSSQGPGFMRLKTYNYPGWAAKIDGKPAEIKTDLHGSQAIEFPPGEHKVELTFGNTLPRTLGTIISGIALLAIFGLTVAGRFGDRLPFAPRGQGAGRAVESPRPAPVTLRPKLWSRPSLLFAAAGVTVAIVAALFFLPRPPADTTGGSPRAQQEKDGPRISLRGVDPGTPVAVASDERSFDELIAALSSQDRARLQTLIESGRAFNVSNNVRVNILGGSGSKVKVLLLEGERADTEAWVLDRWIQNQ
ncbi:MAG TPA: 6-pyruvoyl-tetrahydropterin synthase-related protein [Blastocatellia bacterium]|nr:6-pyruvoyl-tetrahydropterin synthase-related protein [Blastocatellia bacterium]